ncbi:MAG: prepilin-type N-terminal cleavage/methylation domain-containing protein [Bacteroidia bacterium]|nr:prepilin-type N-terminal cleavage/methylation domain-containing protein [Bacteroidia bacterium]
MASIKKLPSFTLIEVLVSMIIILVMSSLATLAFVNLSGMGKNRKKLEAIIYTTNILNEAKKEYNYLDEEFNFPGMIIKKTTEEYPNTKSLKILKISAFTIENKPIIEREEIIRVQITEITNQVTN